MHTYVCARVTVHTYIYKMKILRYVSIYISVCGDTLETNTKVHKYMNNNK